MGVVFLDIRDLPVRRPLPGWHGRFFHSDAMTFAHYDVDADAVEIHEHYHPEEEVWNVVEGRIVLTIDGVEYVAGTGCAAVVRSNVRHAARPLDGPSRVIVVDHPVRDRVGGVSIA
jgi:mannose-6-phosphate isomerase-like protein (cupin superfamily)